MATPRSARLMDVGILNFAAGDQGRAVPGALGSDGGRSVYCGKGHLVQEFQNQSKCCDLCPGRMKGTTMYGCGMCNFGMCQRCYEGKADSDVGTGPLGRGLNEVRRNNRFYDIGAHSGMFIASVRLGIMCHCDRNGIIKMQTPPTSSLKSREMRPDEAANVIFHLLDTTRQQVQYFVIFGCNTGGLDGCVTTNNFATALSKKFPMAEVWAPLAFLHAQHGNAQVAIMVPNIQPGKVDLIRTLPEWAQFQNGSATGRYSSSVEMGYCEPGFSFQTSITFSRSDPVTKFLLSGPQGPSPEDVMKSFFKRFDRSLLSQEVVKGDGAKVASQIAGWISETLKSPDNAELIESRIRNEIISHVVGDARMWGTTVQTCSGIFGGSVRVHESGAIGVFFGAAVKPGRFS